MDGSSSKVESVPEKIGTSGFSRAGGAPSRDAGEELKLAKVQMRR